MDILKKSKNIVFSVQSVKTTNQIILISADTFAENNLAQHCNFQFGKLILICPETIFDENINCCFN